MKNRNTRRPPRICARQASTRAERREREATAWEVYRDGREIDLIFAQNYTAQELRRSLIEHDGYSPDIEVRPVYGAARLARR